MWCRDVHWWSKPLRAYTGAQIPPLDPAPRLMPPSLLCASSTMSIDVVAVPRVDTADVSPTMAVLFDYPSYWPAVATNTKQFAFNNSALNSHPTSLATSKLAQTQPPASNTFATFLFSNNTSSSHQTQSNTSSTTRSAQGSTTPFYYTVAPTAIDPLQHSASTYTKQHSTASAAGGGGGGGGNSEDNPAPHRGGGRRGKGGGKRGNRKVKRGGGGGGGGGGDDDDPPRRTPRKTANACGFCRGASIWCHPDVVSVVADYQLFFFYSSCCRCLFLASLTNRGSNAFTSKTRRCDLYVYVTRQHCFG